MILRSEYQACDFLLDRIDLRVSINRTTTVEALLKLRRRPGSEASAPLRLDGRQMQLMSLELDGRKLSDREYRIEPEALVIDAVPAAFELRSTVRIDPETNTALEGWYRSGPMLCTQCEARGFSRITYALDRPDVLSRYRVRLEADASQYPVLLANGNRTESGAVPGARHYVVWEDPFPKPCYLFAMVAGDLARVEGRHVTAGGRVVDLHFYVDHGNQDRVGHAMHALQKAMAWDERVYGLEYDLDTYMVVAARDFNMGAMENKGLNLFNARFVLASPATATDEDYDGIESVIAHEYFHNWTGNRVTCRDWFQLSLKEGLTVFRDQCFSADHGSPEVVRIEQVRMLRTLQFPEDAGPTAHPVRPDAYSEVNNLYTATVYEKGAEILRMLCSLLGADIFVAGVREYLRRHDGTAATVEDLLDALQNVSGRPLDGFARWYAQSGTPRVEIQDEYDPATQRYRLRLRQATPPTADQAHKQVLPIPIRIGLRGPQGQRLPLNSDSPLLARPELILLEDEHAEIEFTGLAQAPVPSFLHGFSAPVHLAFAHPAEALAVQALHEDDGYVRWQALQRLMLDALSERMDHAGDTQDTEDTGGGDDGPHQRILLQTLQTLAAHPPEDKALLAELLRLPEPAELCGQIEPLHPLRLARARSGLARAIGLALTGPLSVWADWAPEGRTSGDAARRRLSGLALGYLVRTGSAPMRDLALRRSGASCMSLVMGALRALRDCRSPQRDQAMDAFLDRHRRDALVLDKWFALQAGADLPQPLDRVRALLEHPDYQPNPNRCRAVLGVFARENLAGFHSQDGGGYRLLAAQVAKLDRGNPQLAARLIEGLLGWRRMAAPFGGHMRATLQDLNTQALSPDLREKVDKALQGVT